MRPGNDRAAGALRSAVPLLLVLHVGMASAAPKGGAAHHSTGTPLDDIVMYAVDADSDELIRHRFGEESDPVVGVLRYPNGDIAEHVECLGYIPSGVNRGLYGVDNYNGNTQSRLVKVNVLEAVVEPAASDVGFGNVEGMVAFWQPGADRWTLYAVEDGDTALGASLAMTWSINGQDRPTIFPTGTWNANFARWEYEGSQTAAPGVTVDFSLNVKPEGFIGGSIAVENTADETVEVEITFQHPLTASRSGGTWMHASTALGFTTDGGGGTLGLVDGTPLWQGMIDSAEIGATASLYSDPFELHNDSLGSLSDEGDFDMGGPDAMLSFGNRFSFSITPHDQMSLGTNFLLTGESDPAETKNLIWIDPETGVGSVIMPVDHSFEGLAAGGNGLLYASRHDELWAINLSTLSVTHVGTHGFDQVEALEFAMGSQSPKITIPGVPKPWTSGGALLGYSDEAETLLVIYPFTGQAMAYDWEIDVSDLEGMIFTTWIDDPFGNIIAVVGD